MEGVLGDGDVSTGKSASAQFFDALRASLTPSPCVCVCVCGVYV